MHPLHLMQMVKALAVVAHAALPAKVLHLATTHRHLRLRPATAAMTHRVVNAQSKTAKTAAAAKATTARASALRVTTHAAQLHKALTKPRHLASLVSPVNSASLASPANPAAKATTALTTNLHAPMPTWAPRRVTRRVRHAATPAASQTQPVPALT